MTENQISRIVIGKAIEIHRSLGPGLLESAYRECLAYELLNEGLKIEKEKPMPIIYKDIKLNHGYRLDLLVENTLVIELKAVDTIIDVHSAQILTYIKLGGYKLGLLINFNVILLKDGVRRFVNHL